MTGGFALIAYPATPGDSGVMTFIVDQDGIVYQKNLGLDTKRIAADVTQYNPDESWKPSDNEASRSAFTETDPADRRFDPNQSSGGSSALVS